MKIVITHAYFIADDASEQKIMKPYPPLGLLYVSAHLKRNGFQPQVFDSTFSSQQAWKDFMRAEQPDVVLFYANLITKPVTLLLLQFLKQNTQAIAIAGGPDVTYNKENYLKHGFDYLVVGEGEETAFDLIKSLETGSEKHDISGLAFLENGKLITTLARTKIKEMDSIGLPDRDAIDFEKYLQTWETHHGMRMANISTQRGCPYTCKWCSTAVYGQSYRRRPAGAVADEITLLQEKYGVNGLWFVDDVFTVNHKWLTDLHHEFKARNLTIDFEIITRAERLNQAVLKQLKEMGCFRIWIGAESGSQKIINAMDRKVNVNTVREMINKTKAFGMQAGTFIMVGYPGEGLAEIQETVEHLKVATPNELTATIAYPIKGTSLYSEMETQLIIPGQWHEITDRNLDFTRKHSRKFYEYALRYVLSSYQQFKNTGFLKLKFMLKSKMLFGVLVILQFQKRDK